jgi:WD40 repeat protein
MRCHRWDLGSLLVLTAMAGVCQAEAPPRLRASWKERDARVEAFSPDGRSLVSSGAGGYRLRDVETGQVRAVLSTSPHQLHGLQFSPDGQLLFAKVTSGERKPVTVFDLKAWDVATGRTHGIIPYISESINGSTEHFALSPDGKMLATLDNSERLPMQVKASKMLFDGRHEVETFYNASPGLPRVRLWSVPDWKETGVLDGGSHLVFSPDGTALATGSRDWRVPVAKLWDTATKELRAELDGKAQWVKPMTFSPDGKFLAISGREEETLWELGNRKKWMVPVKNGGSRAPAFSPDGGLLFPNGLPSGHPSRNMNVEFPCYDVSSLPPRRLELGEGQFVVQPLTLNEPRLLVSLATMRYAAFGQAGEQGHRTIVLHSLPDRRVLGQSTVNGLDRAEFSPDGRWLALLVGRHAELPGGQGTQYRMEIQLLDPATARVLATVPSPGQTWGNHGLTFSADGRSLAVYYRTGSNVSRPGDPDPSDRPMNIEVWEVWPR